MDAALTDACLADTASVAVKDLLTTTTARAVDLGAFGAPTLFVTRTSGGALPAPLFPISAAGTTAASGVTCDAEMFFGSDRFEQLAALYGLPFSGTYAVPPRPRL